MLFIAIIVIAILLIRRRNKSKVSILEEKNRETETPIEMDKVTEYGGIVNPVATTSTRPTSTMDISGQHSVPYNEIEFKKEIGSGSFGKVFLGTWQRTSVAIKICSTMSKEQINDFLQEAKLMMYVNSSIFSFYRRMNLIDIIVTYGHTQMLLDCWDCHQMVRHLQ